jgi:hypothetical protein
MLSEAFVLKLRASRRGYKIAESVGMDGPALSRLLAFNDMLRRRDPRFLKMGKALGLKRGEVFES